jgi:hypothetical protein
VLWSINVRFESVTDSAQWGGTGVRGQLPLHAAALMVGHNPENGKDEYQPIVFPKM